MANNNITTQNSAGSPRTGSTLNLLAGAWLIVSPFIFGYSTTNMMDDSIFTGIAVAVLAIIGMATKSETWSRWLNILAGIWLILSAAAYAYAGSLALVWNDVILGILIVSFASWSVNAVRHEHHLATG